MVERFRDLTKNRLRRGVFRDVEELIEAIETYARDRELAGTMSIRAGGRRFRAPSRAA